MKIRYKNGEVFEFENVEYPKTTENNFLVAIIRNTEININLNEVLDYAVKNKALEIQKETD